MQIGIPVLAAADSLFLLSMPAAPNTVATLFHTMEGEMLLNKNAIGFDGIVPALGEVPVYTLGDTVSISSRTPIAHYRMPTYLRGKRGIVEAVVRPMAVNNEEEAYGRNAGSKGHYYRVAIPMTEIWPNYEGSPKDSLRIEIFENWLERIPNV